MKKYLKTMYKTASKDVIKKLVVAVQKMEQDILFYENNWHLFKNTKFDTVDGVSDHEAVNDND